MPCNRILISLFTVTAVELINRPSERPLGSGEGSQGHAVAAIANAVAHATGKRLRDLPFDAARVKTAIG
jgi:nicotinate dehydrogenase subunit B